MADRIELRGVEITACHGVLPEEKTTPQPFVVDVVLWLDAREAAYSDDLRFSINYAEVAEMVVAVVSGPPVNLIETLAGRAADQILAAYSCLHAVEVTVHKPQAPIPHPFRDVATVARRSRPRAGRDAQ